MNAIIKTSCGTEVLIDGDFLDQLSSFNWFLYQGYPCTSVTNDGKKTRIAMHDMICQARGDGIKRIVEHLNGNKLDHQKDNLVRLTRAEKAWRIKGNTSGRYKGVVDTKTRGFRVTLTKNGKKLHVGYFHDEEEASLAYDIVARVLYGQNCYVNVLDEGIEKLGIKGINTRKVIKKLISWGKVTLEELSALGITFT